ncbi:hypothetical protein A6769_38695 [Nostoc punctiforme NIES-2108]|uniref:Phage portal protein n=1 Tax=Nostoc punctiforme NIES-2108 TaxID=1356359 RepID=A0A367RX35_NOSPU|nr:hypothetical protein A6769_38695 [Nostoc punctiforme NIES-2108]
MTTIENSSKLIPLYATELAPWLDELDTDFVRELPETGETYTLEDLIKMIKICVVNKAAINLKTMRAAAAVGLYSHNDPTPYPTATGPQTIQEWMRGNFDSMKGSLPAVVRKMIKQAYSLGTSCGGIRWYKRKTSLGSEWRLKSIPVLNPLRYSFAGVKGRVDRIIYRPLHDSSKAIPYAKLLHIYSPSLEEPEDPRGDPAAASALPFYKSRQIMYKQWTQAGQRQATGFTIIKAPSEKTVTILGSNGLPLRNDDGTIKTQPALYAAVSSAKNIENGSVFGTDKENDVINVPGGGGEGFFNLSLTHYEKMIFYAYGVPSTIFNDTASGIGNSGINAGHRLILDTQIEDIVNDLRDELLEKIVRPLLMANFGPKFEDNLGEFKSDKFLDPSLAATRVSNLTIAMSSGTIDANDLEATNRLREDLGLSPFTKEQFDQQQLAKLLAQQEQQYGEGY